MMLLLLVFVICPCCCCCRCRCRCCCCCYCCSFCSLPIQYHRCWISESVSTRFSDYSSSSSDGHERIVIKCCSLDTHSGPIALMKCKFQNPCTIKAATVAEAQAVAQQKYKLLFSQDVAPYAQMGFPISKPKERAKERKREEESNSNSNSNRTTSMFNISSNDSNSNNNNNNSKNTNKKISGNSC